ncbi:MAG: NAD(P)H-hydrate dehydratase [Pseudomonadota bacterium]
MKIFTLSYWQDVIAQLDKTSFPLSSAEESRTLDRALISEYLPAFDWMQRAGGFAFRFIETEYPKRPKLWIVVGSGKNAGDGWILAHQAAEAGWSVTVITLNSTALLNSSAKQAYELARQIPLLKTVDFQQGSLEFEELKPDTDLIVDAILGTGLSRPVSGDYEKVIEWINNQKCPKISLDVPTGVCSDSGQIFGYAVYADITLTFITRKRGLMLNAGREHAGRVIFNDLGADPKICRQQKIQLHSLNTHSLIPKPRRRDAHKGHYGHLLCIGGNENMPGAIVMAAEAGSHIGTAKVTIATHKEHFNGILARSPHIMLCDINNQKHLEFACSVASCILIGPGIGRSDWAKNLTKTILQLDKPLVIDADALYHLAEIELPKASSPRPWILTPHPGEAQRLLKNSTLPKTDPIQAIQQLINQYYCTMVLKGAGTLVADPINASSLPIHLCLQGNPGLAKGGSGDVLGGLIAGLCAQGFGLDIASRLAVGLHANSADELARIFGERSFNVSDLALSSGRLFDAWVGFKAFIYKH